MSAEPSAASETDSEDPIGARYPNTARIWNYQLGGKDNFAVDRKASEAANAMVRSLGVPDGANTAIESRHLLQRMVDYMVGQGVRQFLDLGSGLPNMANTHQIARRTAPDLDKPLRDTQDSDGDGGTVLKPASPQPLAADRGMGWHWCGVGIKD